MTHPLEQTYPNREAWLAAPNVRTATIERFPGYQFGEDGSVWSSHRCMCKPSKWRKLKQTPTDQRYLVVGIRQRGATTARNEYVHRLILEAFKGPRPVGCESRHFPDGTRSNNRIDNLHWGTRSQNLGVDKWEQGTMPNGESHYMTKLTLAQVTQIRDLYANGVRQAELSRKFSVSRYMIWCIVHRKTWSRAS